MQHILASDQTAAFYHDLFVETQVQHFASLFDLAKTPKNVADVGGGCGFFAKSLMEQSGYSVKVLDVDQPSIKACHAAGIVAIESDALRPKITGEENIATFNLILHHLVSDSESATLAMQTKALAVWTQQVQHVFVHEYIYESYLSNFSGSLIYQITKSPVLSWIGNLVSKVVPTLKANTFGVGVRFRANKEWCQVFDEAGYKVESVVIGQNENVSLARRLLLIKEIRRDSFLLIPKASEAVNTTCKH
jgi:hypothetical protein